MIKFGVKMKKRIALLVGFALVGYIGLSVYIIVNQGIEELLICSDKGGLKIPFSKQVCRKYLLTVRGTQKDIKILQQGVGASFVVQGEASLIEREEILKYLISKGLDINQIDIHALSPLQGAILANSTEEIEILLRNGANPNLKENKFQLTPLELALKLQSENKSLSNLSTIISILKNANGNAQYSTQGDGR